MAYYWTLPIFALALIFLIHNVYADPIQADNKNIEIINLLAQPSTIKVGDNFVINATLINNSQNPIYVRFECGERLFSVIFDSHVAVDQKEATICLDIFMLRLLNPGETITGTSPSVSSLIYRAAAAGIANATVNFSYFIKNQTGHNPSGNLKTISKSLMFTIYDNNTGIKTINETVLSPLKQFKSGISVYNVKCKQGLFLAMKTSDNSPACVKLETLRKLVERGWGVLKGQTVWFELKVGVITNDWKYFPWAKEYVKSSDFSSVLESCHNATRIMQYFENQGVTLIQVKEFAMQVANTISMCGPANFYFLVPQNDTSKMTELGFKAINEKEVQGTEVLLPSIRNTEQKVWFEYHPMVCQKTPWINWSMNFSRVDTEAGWIKWYFEDQGITILDSRVVYNQMAIQPFSCSSPFVNGYYLLVSESDSNKMIKLGYKTFTNPLPANAVPVQ